jgi:very-short-patch-repair endonuclease
MESYDLDRGEEDLTLLLHAWPDIEQAILREAEKEPDFRRTYETLVGALRRAFRVEVVSERGFHGHRVLGYVVLFDVNDYEARQAAAAMQDGLYSIDELTHNHAPTQGPRSRIRVRVVPSGKPIEGEVCPRVMASVAVTPEIWDLPEPEPPVTSVPLVQRGLHKLTPIEAPFFDALHETDLTFVVQPRVQGPDRVYRPDFIVFYAGQAAVVEIDGHEGHKTKEQRAKDSERQLWFEARRLRVFRWTGSQVYANAIGCVSQLLEILRGTQARP